MISNFTLKRGFALLGIVLAILSALTYATVQMMHDAKSRVQEAADARYRSYQLAEELKQSSQDLTALVRSYVATGDRQYETRYNDIVAMVTGKRPRANGVTVSTMEQMKQAGFTEQELAKLSQAQTLSLTLVKTEEKAMAAVKGMFDDGSGRYVKSGEPDMELARKLVNDLAYENAVGQIMKPVADFVAMMDARTGKQMQDARDFSGNAFLLCIGMLAAMLGLSIMGLCMLFRFIRNQLERGLKAAERLATGDLRVKLDAGREDEIGRLMGAINGIGQGLAQVVSTVRNGTETINVAAGEIATGNMDLSSRTESQASSLEETAGSMDKLTSTVQQNTANAREANQLANSASELANRGGAVVGNVVQTMESIKASSGKIADIISVIDGLAFQTNILALNAAVEAARAGEQGRGFAVVASEVRSLAQRSASAAKEIKELIVDSVEKVDAGGKLVDEAGVTMGELVSSVRHVAEIMREITLASEEQSTGIARVNDTIVQMESMTQQNAALVEQAAAAAGSLREQSDRLLKDVSIFKLSDDHGHNPGAAVKPRPAAVRGAPGPAKAVPKLESKPGEEPARKAAAGGGDRGEF
ncbi:methyl-accepting chemotaxis protein [Herbaspirillum sp. WKF16]|uniref:methyl-accepting chemotaxis protein n=1 Tax=Herbaspirillum sp. WKF16 TaxID=3028312 RepID=UPI0023A9B429|nr:methyl-accepting chemotaxis protein [Herbaspirillum sp. WKF16]WDZ96063.1 methyl-accepting chemotaxis protein [Herbaspirillum sp. WKF16]